MKKSLVLGIFFLIVTVIQDQNLNAQPSTVFVNRSEKKIEFFSKKIYFLLDDDAQAQKNVSALAQHEWKKHSLAPGKTTTLLTMPNVRYILIKIQNKIINVHKTGTFEQKHYLLEIKKRYAMEWSKAGQHWVLLSF